MHTRCHLRVKDDLPLVLQLNEEGQNFGEGFEVVQSAQLVPGAVGQPRDGLFWDFHDRHAASQQEIPLVLVQLTLLSFDIRVQQEGKQDLWGVDRRS